MDKSCPEPYHQHGERPCHQGHMAQQNCARHKANALMPQRRGLQAAARTKRQDRGKARRGGRCCSRTISGILFSYILVVLCNKLLGNIEQHAGRGCICETLQLRKAEDDVQNN